MLAPERQSGLVCRVYEDDRLVRGEGRRRRVQERLGVRRPPGARDDDLAQVACAWMKDCSSAWVIMRTSDQKSPLHKACGHASSTA